jgi:hypothetical protein
MKNDRMLTTNAYATKTQNELQAQAVMNDMKIDIPKRILAATTRPL